MLGDSPSLALSDGYNLTPQFVVNVEAAFAQKRNSGVTFSVEKNGTRCFLGYILHRYMRRMTKKGYELAVGGQYTTDFF